MELTLANKNNGVNNPDVPMGVQGFPANDEGWPGSVSIGIGRAIGAHVGIFYGAFHTSVECAVKFRSVLARAIEVSEGNGLERSHRPVSMRHLEAHTRNAPVFMGATAYTKPRDGEPTRQVSLSFRFGPLQGQFWTPTTDARKLLDALDKALGRAMTHEKTGIMTH